MGLDHYSIALSSHNNRLYMGYRHHSEPVLGIQDRERGL